jgi:hypothetical protein
VYFRPTAAVRSADRAVSAVAVFAIAARYAEPPVNACRNPAPCPISVFAVVTAPYSSPARERPDPSTPANADGSTGIPSSTRSFAACAVYRVDPAATATCAAVTDATRSGSSACQDVSRSGVMREFHNRTVTVAARSPTRTTRSCRP